MIPVSLSLLAQAAPAAQQSFGSMLPFILIPVMLYFMMIRPQQRREKERLATLATLKTGDEIITSSGIYGIITNISERTLTVKIADGVKIKLERSFVASIVKKSDEPQVIETEVVPS